MFTSLTLVLALALGAGGGARAAKPVEHWRAESGGYALTFYPGFASRAYIQEPSGKIVELYRQNGSFPLPAGESVAAANHQIRLNGVALDESVAIAVADPNHDVASIRVALYNGSTLVLDNRAVTCPPDCRLVEKAGGAVYPSRMIADAGRFDAPLTSVSAHGYDVAFYGGFARVVTSSVAGELYRQATPFQLGDAGKSARHEVRISGGPANRDITLGLIDGEHQIARISLDLYGQDKDETIDIVDDVITCPPFCK